MIPGANILNTALSVIARQSFQYSAYLKRTLQSNGQYLTVYRPACSITGSIQPVPRSLYAINGLEFDKYYVNFFLAKNVFDVARDIAGDVISYCGEYYQLESKTDWFGMDGWVQVLAVKVPNPL